MKKLAPKRYWRIAGYDGTDAILDITVGIGQFTEKQIEQLLRALAAKAGLTLREVVGAYATRKTRIANDLLRVHWDHNYPQVTCGSNPHFIAAVVDEHGKCHRYPLAPAEVGS